MPGRSRDGAVHHARLDSEHEVQVGLLAALRSAVARVGSVNAQPQAEIACRADDDPLDIPDTDIEPAGAPNCETAAEMFDAGAILDQLVAYTAVHFMAEQLLMRLHGYSGFDAHQQEHDRLIEQVQELQQRFRSGDMTLTLATIDSLEAWLVGHIHGMDQALSAFLNHLPGAERPSAPV